LNYEINLGMSFNWRHYDVVEHPGFFALGSSVNAHLGGNLYLKKPLSNDLDLHLGMNFLHFSNGTIRAPNYGLNSMAAFVELAYNINRERNKVIPEKPEAPFDRAEKRPVHDISFFVTYRSISVDTLGTRLKSKYPQHLFRVAGLNYAILFRKSYRFMWGPCLNLVYDEGHNARVIAMTSEARNSYQEVIRLGKVSERLSLGLSLRGELTMPGYSVFVNLGYDFLSRNSDFESRLYQIYGVKMYLAKNVSASLGVKSNNLTQSKYLFISLGYSF